MPDGCKRFRTAPSPTESGFAYIGEANGIISLENVLIKGYDNSTSGFGLRGPLTGVRFLYSVPPDHE